MEILQRIAEPVFAVSIGAAPIWLGLLVSEARAMRARLREAGRLAGAP